MDFVYVASGGIGSGGPAPVPVSTNFYRVEGSGTVYVEGCSVVSRTECTIFKYDVGEIVYVCEVAQKKGKLEPICIKEVIISRGVFSSFSGCFPPPPGEVISYRDTLNTVWLEHELCTQAEVIAIAKAYWQALKDDAERLSC